MSASPSPQDSCTCCMSPEPWAFTALTGGVDSRGRPAAAAAADGDEGLEGVWGGAKDPWRPILVLGDREGVR